MSTSIIEKLVLCTSKAEKSAFEDELQKAGEYWSVIKHETKDVAKDVKDGAKKAYEKTKDTIKDAVEEIREEF